MPKRQHYSIGEIQTWIGAYWQPIERGGIRFKHTTETRDLMRLDNSNTFDDSERSARLPNYSVEYHAIIAREIVGLFNSGKPKQHSRARRELKRLEELHNGLLQLANVCPKCFNPIRYERVQLVEIKPSAKQLEDYRDNPQQLKLELEKQARAVWQLLQRSGEQGYIIANSKSVSEYKPAHRKSIRRTTQKGAKRSNVRNWKLGNDISEFETVWIKSDGGALIPKRVRRFDDKYRFPKTESNLIQRVTVTNRIIATVSAHYRIRPTENDKRAFGLVDGTRLPNGKFSFIRSIGNIARKRYFDDLSNELPNVKSEYRIFDLTCKCPK